MAQFTPPRMMGMGQGPIGTQPGYSPLPQGRPSPLGTQVPPQGMGGGYNPQQIALLMQALQGR
jgi:hypothetical protein